MQPGDVKDTGGHTKVIGLDRFPPQHTGQDRSKKFVDWYADYYGVRFDGLSRTTTSENNGNGLSKMKISKQLFQCSLYKLSTFALALIWCISWA